MGCLVDKMYDIVSSAPRPWLWMSSNLGHSLDWCILVIININPCYYCYRKLSGGERFWLTEAGMATASN